MVVSVEGPHAVGCWPTAAIPWFAPSVPAAPANTVVNKHDVPQRTEQNSCCYAESNRVALAAGAAAAALFQLSGRSLRHRRKPAGRRALDADASNLDRELSALDDEHAVFYVPVRGGTGTIAMKRFLAATRGKMIPQLLPAVLIVHDGPGLASRYLEPLASRLRVGGRACYMYDQLGCGLSRSAPGDTVTSLDDDVKDLRDILHFLSSRLGEAEIHLLGHGYGGALIMEALLRGNLLDSSPLSTSNTSSTAPLGRSPGPQLRSVVLSGVASSTALANEAARSLMVATERVLGPASPDGGRAFWFRHNCGLRPQPACLSAAYAEASDSGRWGALAGWEWRVGAGWELRDSPTLKGWQITRDEVASGYQAAAGGAPLLSIRGEHDFVTEPCVEAWRGVRDGVGNDFAYRELVVGGCGHHAHLEDPHGFAAKIRLWLLGVEDSDFHGTSACSSGSRVATGSSSNVECEEESCEISRLRPLGRAEARQQLAGWASALSWLSGRRRTSGRDRSRFSVMPHRLDPGVASHLDGRTQSREARRLAEWAWDLPRMPVERLQKKGAEQDDAVWALQLCASAAKSRRPERRIALGLESDDGASLDAVACVEVIGAAASPHASRGVKDALVRLVQDLIAEAVKTVSRS